MTYLPWTVTFFAMLPPIPILVFLIISGGFFILGLVMYMTSTDMSIEDLLTLLPRTIVTVRKHLNRKKVVGIILILLGGLATATFADQANAQFLFTSPSGGGPYLVKCGDLSNLACWTIGNSGAVSTTNSTLCTPSNSLCSPTKQTSNALFLSATFLANGAAFAWTSMPVACCTEIFGDNTHETTFTIGNQTATAKYLGHFVTSCVTGSTSATAFLKVQFSKDVGVTWNDLDGGSGSGKVLVGNTVCGTGSPPPPDDTALFSVPSTNFVTNTGIFLRIVGGSGGGVGDNPSFTNIRLDIYTTLSTIL